MWWKLTREFLTRLVIILRSAIMTVLALYVAGAFVYGAVRLLFGDRWWWLSLINSFSLFIFLPAPLILVVALISKQRRLTLATLVLTLVTLLWVVPYYFPSKAAAASSNPPGTTLRIVTFNAWGIGNQHVGEMEAWLRQTNADVVFIQEKPLGYLSKQVPKFLDLYPYQDVQTCYDCILILSRYPFQTVSDYPIAGPIDMSFGLQRVTVQIGSRTVALYNVHLAAPFMAAPRFTLAHSQSSELNLAARFDDSVRDAQIHLLLAKLDTEQLPYIAAGDFNTSDQSVIYGDLAAKMSDTFREVGVGLGGSWPVSQIVGLPDFVPPLIRIDYVWHSKEFSAVSAAQGPRLGSDHLPLLATLNLGGS